jgi:hypothetical protein
MEDVWTKARSSSGAAGANSGGAAPGSPPGEPGSRTVAGVLGALVRDPAHHLLSRWNWKSALLSSLLRAAIFFSTNLVAGLHAALGAMAAELALRSATSGFYGAVTEAFASVEPPWAAMTATMLLLPFVAHSLEFLVHSLRRTPQLGLSIAASVAFTAVSTAFNLYAMQRGALIVGRGSRPLREDLSRIPGLVLAFLTAGPRFLVARALPGSRPR